MSSDAPYLAEHDAPDGAAPRRWRPFGWLTVVAVGWVLYELTAQPALGSVAVCLKFGWDDFLTAIWLRRRDPDAYRGRACFWLYLAGGLWNTAAVAGIMLLAFAVVGAHRRRPAAAADPLLDTLLWTGTTTLIGLGCSALAFAYAAVLAWRGRFRLWLSRAAHAARRRAAWPPAAAGAGHPNRAGFMVMATLLLIGIPLLLVCVSFAAFLVVAVADMAWALVIVMPLVVAGGAAALLYAVDALKHAVLADHPWQCWGPPDGAESVADGAPYPVQ